MKSFFLTTIIALFLLVCSNGLQAQPSQTKLNQVELMKQFIGSWKCDGNKDTTRFWDARSYGTGLECTYKSMTKREIITEGKELYGYESIIDKCIDAVLFKGYDIALYAFWFILKDKYVMLPYNDISNSERSTFKVEGEFKSADMIVETITVNNKQIRTDTWIRVK